MRLLLMADKYVGDVITRFLIESYREDIAAVVTTKENDIFVLARNSNIPCAVYESPEQVMALAGEVDLGILAWWPNMVPLPLIRFPKHGTINTHPSLLPFCRGKHTNFWAIVEKAPYGVSIHKVGNGVDDGPIVVQVYLLYDWEDTGESLYRRAEERMIRLFKACYPRIRTLDFPLYPQDLSKGSFHKANELNEASRIDLDEVYVAEDLLNRLRARTFPGHPACWFEDNGVTYEVRIEIRRRKA